MTAYTVGVDPEQTATWPPQGRWTVADWERLPESADRYEIIDGVLHMTTAPSSFHQWVIKRLERLIGNVLEDLHLGLSFFAPIGLVIESASAVQPDFVVIRSEHLGILRGGRIRGAPDLVVEVQSPGNTPRQMADKLHLYARLGVPEYVVIDPATRTLTRYQQPEAAQYVESQIFHEGETVTFACLPEVPLAVAALFAGAPDLSLEVE